jgi:hypothetical protein
MTSMEEQMKCFYLDSSLKPASDMLRKCVQNKSSPYIFKCGDDPMRQETSWDLKDTARMNDISIQRGIVDYHVGDYMNPQNRTSNNIKITDSKLNFNSGTEGFTNYFVTDNGPGKSSISYGQCPEGYTWCSKTGKCIQKCIGCVYRDNMKSREFNEADPCFPEGTYNGVTNEGYIKCTCGSSNQYCSDDFIKNIFTPDGMMIVGQKIVMNVGNPNSVDSLFNFDYL